MGECKECLRLSEAGKRLQAEARRMREELVTVRRRVAELEAAERIRSSRPESPADKLRRAFGL